jgi:hypothetical protein
MPLTALGANNCEVTSLRYGRVFPRGVDGFEHVVTEEVVSSSHLGHDGLAALFFPREAIDSQDWTTYIPLASFLISIASRFWTLMLSRSI